MIKTTVFNSREKDITSNDLIKNYLKTLKKKGLRGIITNILENYLDPLGYDSPVQFREAVSDGQREYGETGFYCLHSGEKIG